MPDSYPDSPPEPAAGSARHSPLSRRSVLRGAAGAGAVGLAVAGGVTAVAGLARPDHPARPDDAAASADARTEPVLVYLRDASTGEMDVFAGTGQTRLRNPALASELLRAIQ
jgi:hypothetical protein